MRIKVVTVDVELSPNTKRAIRWVLLPLAVFLGSTAVAMAYDTSWIAPGAPVQSSRLKSNLDEIQTRLVALETARGTTDVVVVTSSVSAPNPNPNVDEVLVRCPSSHPVPVSGGCHATTLSRIPKLYASVPYRKADGTTGWDCRFESLIGESYYATALCSRGTLTPSSTAFPSLGF